MGLKDFWSTLCNGVSQLMICACSHMILGSGQSTTRTKKHNGFIPLSQEHLLLRRRGCIRMKMYSYASLGGLTLWKCCILALANPTARLLTERKPSATQSYTSRHWQHGILCCQLSSLPKSQGREKEKDREREREREQEGDQRNDKDQETGISPGRRQRTSWINAQVKNTPAICCSRTLKAYQ